MKNGLKVLRGSMIMTGPEKPFIYLFTIAVSLIKSQDNSPTLALSM